MKNRTYAIIGIPAVVMIFLLGFSLSSRPASSAVQTVHSTAGPIGMVYDPSSFLRAGGKDAVDVSIYPKSLNLTRGENGTVSIVLHHIASAANYYPTLHVVANGTSGLMVLPSFSKNMTAFDRSQYFIQGKQPPGVISLSPYISYSPNQVDIDAGQTTNITATVTIPKDLPSEVVGKVIHFNPSFTTTNTQKADQDNVQMFPTYFTVLLEG